jgi:beta-glucosidase
MPNHARLQAIVLGVLVGFSIPSFGQKQPSSGAEAKRPWMDTSLPISQRVDDLIGQMTLEEKVQQMRDHAPAIPRLGVPKYDWWNEGLHGVAFSGYATNFPQVIGMAATWDTGLVHQMAETISTEARAKYDQAMREDHHEMFFGLTFWAPNINIFRDPRWGRGQETYGEDPFLTGQMGVAFVTGMQGNDSTHLSWFQPLSTSPFIVDLRAPVTARTSRSQPTTSKILTCLPSALP